MITTIIVPISLTTDDHQVIRYAVSLAESLNLRILFVHPYQLPQTAHYAAGADGIATYMPERETAEELEIRNDEVRKLLADVPRLDRVVNEWKVQEGTVSAVVEDTVENVTEEEKSRPLVVMGTHGASGVNELFGTIAEKVTRACDCPVLVIPQTSDYKPIEKVCLAVDEDSASQKIDYSLLINILNAYEARLLAIHVHHNDEDLEKTHEAIFNRLEKAIGESVVSKSLHTILYDDAEQGIDQFMHQHDVDLLVLIFREHGFIKRLFNPGVRTKMVYHSDTPLLVLK